MLLRLLLLLTALWAASGACRADPPAVRGVWVAGPQHNRFWESRESMRAELRVFKAGGLNTVYAVMWMQGRTLYPSTLMEQLTGHRQLEVLGQRDAMQELLEEAKPLGLRVVAWMEFGFASHHDGSASLQTLLRLKPDWAALGRDGKPVVKNGFHWMNAFDPKVQGFITDLCLELVRRYPQLDGVQGDDRLPALPSAAGHNPAVLQAYRQAHEGRDPPPDDREPAWLQWRADRLTAFLRQWRGALKAERPDLVISLSPSPFPWGLKEYLQDWPTWLSEGLADELLPQLYRRDLPAYQSLLRETRAAIPAGQAHRVFPGLLLALGPTVVPSATLLGQWLEATRAAGFAGEVYFHSTGIAPRLSVLKRAYDAE
jgi:uncharacterized lipoprotein YddW (UPF0748 family)